MSCFRARGIRGNTMRLFSSIHNTDFRCSVQRNVGTQLRHHAPHVRKIRTLLHMSPQRPRMPPLPLPPRPRSTPTPLPRKTPGFRSVSKRKPQVCGKQNEREHLGQFAEPIKNQDKNIAIVRRQLRKSMHKPCFGSMRLNMGACFSMSGRIMKRTWLPRK
jgi:hypothetical protein